MRRVGRAQHLTPLLPLGGCQTRVNVVGRHQAEGHVAVRGGVPGKEAPATALGVLVRSESVREVGSVLQGLELAALLRRQGRQFPRAWARRHITRWEEYNP